MREMIAAALVLLTMAGCATTNNGNMTKVPWPVSNAYHAGLVVEVIREKKPHGKKGKVRGLKMVCSVRESLGPIKPHISKSANLKSNSQSGGGFNFEASVQSSLQIKAQGSQVQVRKVGISNASHEWVSGAQVLEHLKHRTRACWARIRTLLGQGREVALVRSVLRGDIDFLTSYKGNLEGKAAINANKAFALKVGSHYSKKSGFHILGRGLSLSLQLDTNLIAEHGKPKHPKKKYRVLLPLPGRRARTFSAHRP